MGVCLASGETQTNACSGKWRQARTYPGRTLSLKRRLSRAARLLASKTRPVFRIAELATARLKLSGSGLGVGDSPQPIRKSPIDMLWREDRLRIWTTPISLRLSRASEAASRASAGFG